MPTSHSKPSAKKTQSETPQASTKFQFEEGQPALDNFKHTMMALFRVPKSEVRDSAAHKPTTRPTTRKAHS